MGEHSCKFKSCLLRENRGKDTAVHHVTFILPLTTNNLYFYFIYPVHIHLDLCITCINNICAININCIMYNVQKDKNVIVFFIHIRLLVFCTCLCNYIKQKPVAVEV